MTRPKVLLVDDNDQFREMMQVLLQGRNFEVVSASSVTEALGLSPTWLNYGGTGGCSATCRCMSRRPSWVSPRSTSPGC